MQRGKRPYSQFGQRLSEIRKGLRESVHEVSGAIEVETEVIEKFEKGEDRPSEDLLMLLISHFDVKDEEADELFELAGYDMNDSLNPENSQMQPIVVVPIDNRTLYTDKSIVEASSNGLVVNFMQNGLNSQQIPISRVGMSLEQAKLLVDEINESISNVYQSKSPKLLLAPKQRKSSKKSKK